jgi:EAL domain-containing protein (putative c-di-GMP-specific phosphodiesterase class I)
MPRLEFLADPKSPPQRIELDPLPFILGRGSSADFVVPNSQVSYKHAEIFVAGEQFCIRDLGSRNGTVVNGQHIEQTVLTPGDIIQLASSEFRFHAEDQPPAETPSSRVGSETEIAPAGKVPPSVFYGRPLLEAMLRQESIRVVFQPIVDLHTQAVVAHEALGRGQMPDLSTRPADLFRLASRCGMAGALSRAFRRRAIREADVALPAGTELFCNLHPEEFAQFRAEDGDNFLPEVPAQCRLVVEIHEDAVTDIGRLRQLRDFLKGRGVGLAYDDFGAGQARLAELAEAPPDYLKLDMRLIRNIHTAGGRRDVVQAICAAAAALGVTVIAEGLEQPEELEVCRQLGCRLGQGFLLGHPEHTPAPAPR